MGEPMTSPLQVSLKYLIPKSTPNGTYRISRSHDVWYRPRPSALFELPRLPETKHNQHFGGDTIAQVFCILPVQDKTA